MASKIIFYLLFVLDLLLAAFLGWSLFQTHLIPNVAVIIAAAMLVLIPLLLFFLQLEKKKKKTGFRIAAIVILLFLGLVEGAVAFYLHQYNSKMDDVTEVRVQYTQVEVYVKAEDPAQTIEYAVESEYVFGIIAGVDEDAIAQTRAAIEEKCGRTMRIQGYATLADLIKALDEGQVDALLMSSAYLDLLDSLPGYEQYAESLRVLLSTNVQSEVPELTEIFPQTLEEGGENAAPMKDPALWKDCFCAYVSGIDTYGPVTARSRSDVNILAIANTKTKTVLLISTPRDYYVPFNFAPVNGAMDKLTHAGIYGIEGSMRALSDFYGLPVHYYLRVNFTGFINVINTLGGVDFESDTDWSKGSHHISKGMNYNVKGETALRFVRDRYSFADGDRARSRHQMAVIKGIIKSLRSSKILTNYTQLMEDMAGCFQTNASKAMIGELVQLTMDPSKSDWTVLTYNVDGNGRTDYAYSLGAYAYCMIPNMKTVEYAQSLAAAVLAGEPLTQEELQKNAPPPRG